MLLRLLWTPGKWLQSLMRIQTNNPQQEQDAYHHIYLSFTKMSFSDMIIFFQSPLKMFTQWICVCHAYSPPKDTFLFAHQSEVKGQSLRSWWGLDALLLGTSVWQRVELPDSKCLNFANAACFHYSSVQYVKLMYLNMKPIKTEVNKTKTTTEIAVSSSYCWLTSCEKSKPSNMSQLTN